MLWNVSALVSCAILANDGEIGAVTDVLFDDATWTLRWLVVDTGTWLPGRKVLLPLTALGEPEAGLRRFPVRLTKKQVMDSPDIGSEKSVSRRVEADIFDLYGLEPYWGGNLVPLSNAMAVPLLMPLAPDEAIVRQAPEDKPEAEGNPHVRSCNSVTGYHINALDGEIGHAADFLVETQGWTVRYLKVDTKNWWPGQLVLITPKVVRQIDWYQQVIEISVDRQTVKEAPAYHAGMTVDGAFDQKIMAHYNFSGSLGDM